MKLRHIAFILLSLYSVKSYAQDFRAGFEIGYKNGFCYNDFGCIPPIAPIPPIPSLNESSSSFQDGYNRGFQTGLDSKRSSYANHSNGSQQLYTPIPPQDIYKPLSDELLMLGAKAAYDRAARLGQMCREVQNALFNIVTYGRDAEVLADYEKDFTDRIKTLISRGVGNVQVQNTILEQLSLFIENEDIRAIHRKNDFYNREMEARKSAEYRGKKYISPNLDLIIEYYNSNMYYRNIPSFSYFPGFISN